MNLFHKFMSFSTTKKRDLSILFGNAFDHYDISIYSFLAPIIAPLYFPNHDYIVQLILTYSILATAVFTQPLGAFIFGRLASTRGPNFGLSLSLIGVTLSTVLIGFLPGYDSWEYCAPLSLIILRVFRGVFSAGETTIAKLYILEGKTEAQARKASYIYQSSSMVGIVIASALSTLVIWYDPTAWRLCFIFGGVTGFAAYFLRRLAMAREARRENQGESPEHHFTNFNPQSLRILWKYRANVLRVALTDVFGHVTYIVPFVFMNSYVPLMTSVTLETMMGINTILLFLDAALIPMIGPIVARFDPVRVMVLSSLVLTTTFIPLFQFLPEATLPYIIFIRLWVLFWGVVFLCPLNVWCKSLFKDTPEKYFLVGMGGAIGAGTLGRTLTPIFLWLWYTTNIPAMPAVYMTLITFVTAIAIQSSRKQGIVSGMVSRGE